MSFSIQSKSAVDEASLAKKNIYNANFTVNILFSNFYFIYILNNGHDLS